MNDQPSLFRRFIHGAVPSHFTDPFGLFFRLLRSGPDGRFAILLAGLNIIASPLDYVISPTEKRIYQQAPPPKRPILLICGPPRSGTTILALTMARSLPVSFLTNMTAVFPRSPIATSRLLRATPKNESLPLRSHYGRTNGLRSWNDGLHLWDRWLGRDRKSTNQEPSPSRGSELTQFFGAFEQWSHRPLVTKNNSLNVYASAIADYLPTASFICLKRDPLYLCQSLLLARSYIYGDDSISYGIDDPDRVRHPDPVADVCSQVHFYEEMAIRQQEEIGADRFQFLSYEDFCDDPVGVVERLAREILDVRVDRSMIPKSLPVSRSQKLSDDLFLKLKRQLSLEKAV